MKWEKPLNRHGQNDILQNIIKKAGLAMPKTSRHHVEDTLLLLQKVLKPVVVTQCGKKSVDGHLSFGLSASDLDDIQKLLKFMNNYWNEVFKDAWGRDHNQRVRNHVIELIDWRNLWAHQTPMDMDDLDRVVDTAYRLMVAMSMDDYASVFANIRDTVRRNRYQATAPSVSSQATDPAPVPPAASTASSIPASPSKWETPWGVATPMTTALHPELSLSDPKILRNVKRDDYLVLEFTDGSSVRMSPKFPAIDSVHRKAIGLRGKAVRYKTKLQTSAGNWSEQTWFVDVEEAGS